MCAQVTKITAFLLESRLGMVSRKPQGRLKSLSREGEGRSSVCEGKSRVSTYLARLPEEGRVPGPRTGWAATENKVFHNLLLALIHLMEENIKSGKQSHNNYVISSPCYVAPPSSSRLGLDV